MRSQKYPNFSESKWDTTRQSPNGSLSYHIGLLLANQNGGCYDVQTEVPSLSPRVCSPSDVFFWAWIMINDDDKNNQHLHHHHHHHHHRSHTVTHTIMIVMAMIRAA